MFYVAARISDRFNYKSGVVEHACNSVAATANFREAIAINYGGSPEDYYIYITSESRPDAKRAMALEYFRPIWKDKKIIGLKFGPPPPPPKILDRYQILLKNIHA